MSTTQHKVRTGIAVNGIHSDQKGSAIVIALFVLALISVFVAFAMSRSSAEAAATGNETGEARTFYAAQGSLEMMTRNFNKVFEVKLNPSSSDLNAVRNGAVPGLGEYTFLQELDQTSTSTNVVLSGGPYTGLYAIRDNWRLRTTATNNVGIQVQLTRNVLNNRVPIFQFGIFYDDDLELYRPPLFSFGGRVHSNRHFFISPGGAGVYFNSRVTAAGHVVTQTWRNGFTGDSGNNQTFIKNASAVDKQLLPTMGSVLNTTSGASNNIFASDPDLPPSRINPDWEAQSAVFDGNLQSEVKPLKLPLSIGTVTDLIEMVKRGKEVAGPSGGDLANINGVTAPVTAADNEVLRAERFANKTGIRISLADSKAKLPGCASGIGTEAVTTPCGIRLDGDIFGLGANPNTSDSVLARRSRGYQPKSMRTTSGGTFDHIPTRVNGERLFTGSPREVWIKVETVQTNASTQQIETKDVTQDFLSLGVTEQCPTSINIVTGSYSETPLSNSLIASTAQALTSGAGPDSRSIIKIQRFAIPGPAIPGGNNYIFSYGTGSSAMNVVRRYTAVGTNDTNINNGCTSGCTAANLEPPGSNMERYGHLKRATVNGVNDVAIVAFPTTIFDSREGQHYDERSTTYYDNLDKLSVNGVMSMLDIDVANLRRFLRGDFNGMFPVDTPFATSKGSGLTNSDIPQNQGWVLYVSDRRGDADFDGEFDMEDIYGSGKGNDGIKQPGEDVNGDGVLQTAYGTEAEKYNSNTVWPDHAAVKGLKYYRRGIRLINGTVVPGVYDSANAGNTRGFTVASENGVYVRGNYNATGVASIPSTGNTPFNDYLPFNTTLHIPSSIVADGVTILSNAWNDAQSFSSPYDQGNRVASDTTIRFAMISGDTIASKEATPHQGGISPRLNGGVHNFKRFLERWTDKKLNYSGSLINLFVSRNNTGSFKCCNTVYNPPDRNWVFDSTFLYPSRLPPGTPYFQYVQTTGFQRTND